MRKRPVGVTILAILDIYGSIILLFNDYPDFLYLFGKQFSGTFVEVFILASSLVSILIGFGLLKLKMLAWKAYIGIHIFYFFDHVANQILVPEQYPYTSVFRIIFMFFYIFIIFYLIKKKDYFN